MVIKVEHKQIGFNKKHNGYVQHFSVRLRCYCSPALIANLTRTAWAVFKYSQTCVQRPPSGPEKSGRLTEVSDKTEIYTGR